MSLPGIDTAEPVAEPDLSALFSAGNPAVVGVRAVRPEALRPRLSTGLPYALQANAGCWDWQSVVVRRRVARRRIRLVHSVMRISLRDVVHRWFAVTSVFACFLGGLC